jgi:hypothetical protein
MDLSSSVLGRHVVAYLLDRQTSTILKIGKDTFDRASLAHVACFHFTAAANLSRVLNRDLQVKDTRDVFEHVHPDRLALPRLGSVSLAVLGAAFEAKGIGGPTPLETWFLKHREHVVTFSAIKHHEALHEAMARQAEKKARRSRN